MNELRYTLLSDGSSDRALIPIIDWLLNENGVPVPQPEWADLRHLPKRRKPSLKSSIEEALKLYPCDLFFVHRDAEREPYEIRKREIMTALENVTSKPPVVCIVPVRMQEAWLLTSEQAIRYAANNVNGRAQLNLPRLQELEHKPDPKDILKDLILTATELTGQRREKFKRSQLRQAPHRIAQYIKENEGFAPLRHLNAFQQLEADLQQLIDAQNWDSTK